MGRMRARDAELSEQLDALQKLATKRDAIRTAMAFGGGAAG